MPSQQGHGLVDDPQALVLSNPAPFEGVLPATVRESTRIVGYRGWGGSPVGLFDAPRRRGRAGGPAGRAAMGP
jgi:hypothetical protein